MTAIRLVTRADDIGSFSGVTAATVDAHHRGVLRNASIMVPTPWFEACVAPLTALPGLCLGLHLTMCCEWEHQRWKPVLPANRVPCVVNGDGYFLSDPLTIHQRGIVIEQVLAECQAQLDRARAHGLDISYADTHMGWEWMHPQPQGTRLHALLPEWCRRNSIRWSGESNLSNLPIAPSSAHTPSGQLLASLEAAAAGTYLIVGHPCWYGSLLAQETLGRDPGTIAFERVEDWRLLGDPQLRHELDRRGVTLLRYDQL